jgi:uncharacterized protein (TIGR03067 family)
MNRRLCLLVAIFGVSLVAEEKKADVHPLKGKWEIVSASFNGNASPTLKGRILAFGESEFTTYDGEFKGRTIAFTLDPKADPKQIDLNRDGGETKALGIYAIDKDELKLCYAEPGADRPKKFESAAGSKMFLLVMKRMK